ncbi:chymotrypsinogen A-like [Physella acuta]|uniref:chymotrypsinogen A-like n=1 Tax=Physella acuta TaxID=109671 RepID=UPI0027DAE5CD|nr:chymotrypsinogen A-like [Physella acuta]
MGMSTAVLLLLIGLIESSQAATCGLPIKTRILGGISGKSYLYPWMAFIENSYLKYTCGGSIIDETHILTAAHCVSYTDERTGITYPTPASKISVYTGSSIMDGSTNYAEAKKRKVISVAYHEHYDSKLMNNDVAVLTLSAPIVYDRHHIPVCLANGTKTPQMASKCIALGWGNTISYSIGPISDYLLWIDMPIASDDDCQREYTKYYNMNKFCAGAMGKNICAGDSGGPLVCMESDGRYYQYGIASATRNECFTSNALFTKVSSFLPWIAENSSAE